VTVLWQAGWATTQLSLLRDGKSNRVVVMQGERIVDFDITEALEMPRVFDEKLYKISQDLSR